MKTEKKLLKMFFSLAIWLASSVGHVIAHKNITVGNEPRPLVVVAIRGTAHIPGWITNMHAVFASGNDELGFNGAANMVRNNLKAYMTTHNIINPTVLITGHSKGASVSNVLAHKLNIGEDTQLNVAPNKVYTYAFATVGVGKNITTNHQNIFNILNKYDYFTLYPPLFPDLPNSGNWGRHGLDGCVKMDDRSKKNVKPSHEMFTYMNWMDRQSSTLTWLEIENMLS